MAFKERLEKKLHEKAKVVPLFENAIMQGKHGVLVNVTLPPLEGSLFALIICTQHLVFIFSCI